MTLFKMVLGGDVVDKYRPLQTRNTKSTTACVRSDAKTPGKRSNYLKTKSLTATNSTVMSCTNTSTAYEGHTAAKLVQRTMQGFKPRMHINPIPPITRVTTVNTSSNKQEQMRNANTTQLKDPPWHNPKPISYPLLSNSVAAIKHNYCHRIQNEPMLLRVYDISCRSVCRWLSLLVGHDISGVWHTGLNLFGKEYFYGPGILKMRTSDIETLYGLKPKRVHLLGYCRISLLEFESLIVQVMPLFAPRFYDVVKWNCNVFCDVVARILTGYGIPTYINEPPQMINQSKIGNVIVLLLRHMSGIRSCIAPDNPIHPSSILSTYCNNFFHDTTTVMQFIKVALETIATSDDNTTSNTVNIMNSRSSVVTTADTSTGIEEVRRLKLMSNKQVTDVTANCGFSLVQFFNCINEKSVNDRCDILFGESKVNDKTSNEKDVIPIEPNLWLP